ncbi:MAG: PAS domain-containing protein [Lachnospiraceae bacterium]|nr:PAS domain-containing protein [Lachnospiraceae bacterium]
MPETTKDYSNKQEKANALAKVKGHPLHTFVRENQVLSGILKGEDSPEEKIAKISDLSIHYAKKGDLLYPLLKVKYEIAGPSDLMWTEDDEIRDEVSRLKKDSNHDEAWIKVATKALAAAEKMIYKEEQILFPICAVNFTKEEWNGIYRDSKDYDVCFGVKPMHWEDGEKEPPVKQGLTDEIVMPGGHMSVEQMSAMLNTIPLELTFVDADNINRYFNEGPKVFKRPGMAIDRDVFSCHPPKVEVMVRSIIEDFRNGNRDKVPVWMEKGGIPFLVTYMAVRDKEGTYLGTVEVVQNMEEIKKHFEK